MRTVDSPLTLIEGALIASLDQTLAMVDSDTRLRVLASLLIFYLPEHGNALTFQHEDWRLLCIGPGQPTDVAIYEHRILDAWRREDSDDNSEQNK